MHEQQLSTQPTQIEWKSAWLAQKLKRKEPGNKATTAVSVDDITIEPERRMHWHSELLSTPFLRQTAVNQEPITRRSIQLSIVATEHVHYKSWRPGALRSVTAVWIPLPYMVNNKSAELYSKLDIPSRYGLQSE